MGLLEIFGYLSSILIGLSIGLIGAGGSILAVPIFAYLFGVEPTLATSYSLFIVGATAMFGAVRHYFIGNLQLKTAIVFAIPSVISLVFFRKFILPIIPSVIQISETLTISKGTMIMLVFSVLMISASISMIKKSKNDEKKPNINMFSLVMIGLFVGVVTGLLGAGGGFLIIPSLIIFGGLPMKQAIGTSLFIVFINSIIGFTGDLVNGVELNLTLLLSITLIAILGMLLGVRLSQNISGAKLKPAFGWFVLLMGFYIVAKELLFQ